MEEKELKKLLKKYKREKSEYLEGWKRAKADFVNYKKEERKRVNWLLQKEREDILLNILPILDNLRRAEEEAEKNGEKNNIIEGFLKIKEQLEEFLKKEGIEEISAKGEEFDPRFHEAVEMVDSEHGESGTVIGEIEKGYKLNGEIIRPSKVKVVK